MKFVIFLIGLLALATAAEEPETLIDFNVTGSEISDFNITSRSNVSPTNGFEPSYDDESDPDAYIQPQNKEDSFDWKFSQEAFKQNLKENVLVSPISVKILLALLAEAAGDHVDSTMRTELKNVLPFGKTLNDSKLYFKKVLSSFNEPHKDYTVYIASKAYVNKNLFISQRYKSILEYNYHVSLETLNFRNNKASVDTINNWVKLATQGKISNICDSQSMSPNAQMMLLNAVYFKGFWRYPFVDTLTKDFFVEPHAPVEKQFVEQTEDFYYFYSKNLEAKILRLPYEGRRFSMFLLLPFEVDGLEKLIDNLESEKLKEEIDRMESINVHVVLPKFKFDSTINLNSIVQQLGITKIFEDSATFPMLLSADSSSARVKVSKIIQKSGIVVDEKGTEAYAATAIEVIDKFGGSPREFVANHPFVFYIEDDETGAKLFSGIINNPKY